MKRRGKKNQITAKELVLWILANLVLTLPIGFIYGTAKQNFGPIQIADTNLYFALDYFLIFLFMGIIGAVNGFIYKILKVRDLG